MAQPPLLSDAELASALRTLPEWSAQGAVLVRSVTAASFPAAIELVRSAAIRAESLNHHPDIDIRWRTVTFRLSTHSAGGLTALDIDLAHAIDSCCA